MTHQDFRALREQTAAAATSQLPVLTADFTDGDIADMRVMLDKQSASITDDLALNNVAYRATFGSETNRPIVRTHAAYIAAINPRTTEEGAQQLSHDFAHNALAAMAPENASSQDDIHTAYGMFLVAQGAHEDPDKKPTAGQKALKVVALDIAPRVYTGYAAQNSERAFFDNQLHILKQLGTMQPMGDLYQSFTKVAQALLKDIKANTTTDPRRVSGQLGMLLKGIGYVSTYANNQLEPLMDVWGKGYDVLAQVDPQKAKTIANETAGEDHMVIHPKLWTMALEKQDTSPVRNDMTHGAHATGQPQANYGGGSAS